MLVLWRVLDGVPETSHRFNLPGIVLVSKFLDEVLDNTTLSELNCDGQDFI